MGSTTTTNYQHPYITVQIYDNTEFVDEEVSEERKSFNGMQVGFFAGGRDNKLLYMSDRLSELREFGKPNFKTLGQAAYNVDNALATENCGMYVMNLRPETATFSNTVIMVRFKVQENSADESGTDEGGSDSGTEGGDTTQASTGFYDKDDNIIYIKQADGSYNAMSGDDPDVPFADTSLVFSSPEEVEINIQEGYLTPIEWTSKEDLAAVIADIKAGGDGNIHNNDDSESTIPANDADDNTDDDNADTTDDTSVEKKLVYSFYPKYIEGATTESALLAAVSDLMDTDPDEDGFYNMPLFLFYSQGRGAYGNDIHLRFANVTGYVAEDGLFLEYDKPIRHTYTLTVLEPNEDGLESREVGTGTLDVDGFDNSVDYGPSLYLEDVINDLETGSLRIKSRIYSETMDAITELYNNQVVTAGNETPYSLDLLTGYNLNGELNDKLELDSSRDDFINLLALDGFTLSQGTDGFEDMSEDDVAELKNQLLIKAYAGDIDPYIKSRFSSPVNFNLDANYDVRVKKQMAALANLRKYDCMTDLDMGTTSTTSGLINVATVMKNIYGFNVVKEGHYYKFRDAEYTGKVCTFTITHWLAKALPNHMATEDTIYGLPLARDAAILRSKRDYIQGTFFPVIDPDSDDIKETLYKLRVNCYETLTYNSVQRSTAITSCQSKSDRLLEMNEYILQRAVRIAYDLLASKLYKLGEEEDRNRYEEDATDILNNDLKKYVRTASVQFEMTAKDEKKSLLRLKLHLTFKTVIQRGELEVYLDPRVVDETVSVA